MRQELRKLGNVRPKDETITWKEFEEWAKKERPICFAEFLKKARVYGVDVQKPIHLHPISFKKGGLKALSGSAYGRKGRWCFQHLEKEREEDVIC